MEAKLAQGEKVEAELTHLIERHDRRVNWEGHRPSEEIYEESVRRYQEQILAATRAEWHHEFAFKLGGGVALYRMAPTAEHYALPIPREVEDEIAEQWSTVTSHVQSGVS